MGALLANAEKRSARYHFSFRPSLVTLSSLNPRFLVKSSAGDNELEADPSEGLSSLQCNYQRSQCRYKKCKLKSISF